MENLDNTQYDTVIIGSGLGGMLCALLLTKEGQKVCVLEKNRQLGGCLQIFSRDKVVFDTGIHYIGGLDKGQNLHTFFKYFDLMDKIKIKRMDMDGFDHVTFKGDPTVYKHAQGYENFARILGLQFPDEVDNIKKYCDRVQEICEYFPLYRLREESKDLTLADFLTTDTKAYLKTITDNEKLQNVLAGTNPLYAGEADKTPFYVHALVVNTYIESSWKCIGGGGQISKHLAKSIKDLGGVILNYAQASKFHFLEDKVTAIETTDGRLFYGKNFISNCDITKTLEMVEPGKIRPAYRNRINSIDNSMATFILYIVVKEGTLPYFNNNIYHHHVEDVWDGINYTPENWPHGFALFPQNNPKTPEFTESLIVMAYMKYEELKQWAETKNVIPNQIDSRGEDYDNFKEQKAQKLIKAIYDRIPELEGNIRSYTTSTPLTFRDYIGTKDGTMYGLKKDYKDPLKTFITPRTRVPNLFLTGQNLNLHGVLGVTVSSVVTCTEVLNDRSLITRMKEEADRK